MPGIVLGLLLWCPAIVGFGIVARRVTGLPVARARLDLSDVAAGYLALTALALALNFFVGLGQGVATIALIAGWGAVAMAYRGVHPRTLAQMALGPILLVLVVAFAASQPVHYIYDAALYHLQTMQWVQDGTVPKGIANLSGRYGFNSAWLPLATIVRDPMDARALEHAILLPGTLFVFAIIAVIRSWRAARTSTGARVGAFAGLAFASSTVAYTINSTAQDIGALAAWLACTALAVRSFERHPDAPVRVEDAWRVAALGVAIKLSAVPLLLVPLLATLRLPAYVAGPGRARLRLLARYGWLPALVLTLWMARGVALSGCALFPAGVSCFDSLPWSFGSANAPAESRDIIAWARQPGVHESLVPEFPGWVRGWFARSVRHPDIQLPFALIVAGIVSALAAGVAIRPPPGVGALTVVIGVAIAGWLASAPDPRFGAGPLWALGALVVALGTSHGHGARGWRRWIGGAIVLLAWAPHALDALRLVTRPVRNPGLAAVVGSPRLQIVTQPRMRAALTQAGDTIWVPLTERSDQCVLAPFPCAPAVPPGLIVTRDARGRITGFRRGTAAP